MAWDLTRTQWGAGPHRAGVIPLPVSMLVLHHTVTPFWVGAAAARNVQAIAKSRGFVDISYSALATRADELIEAGADRAPIPRATTPEHMLCRWSATWTRLTCRQA
jgi:hypothetical protein